MNKGEEQEEEEAVEAPPTRLCGQVEERYTKYVKGWMDAGAAEGISLDVNPRPSWPPRESD